MPVALSPSLSMQPGRRGLLRSDSLLPAGCVALYLFGCVLLLGSVLRHTDRHFVYALDDPYIHLALAERLAHGLYGINAGEVASPSSSLLWPFLLLPFSGRHLQLFVPLFWNALSAAATAWLIGTCVVRWSRLRPEGSVLNTGQHVWAKRAIVAILLLCTANLWTLTFVGMEHSLEVLLAACCAYGVAEVLSHRPMPVVSLAAAALLPSVRYEGIALTLAVAMALYGARRRWSGPLVLLAVALAPLAAFSVFLHAHGLPLLPSSVLVKSQAVTASNPVKHLLSLVRENLREMSDGVERWPPAVLALIFTQLWWKERDRVRRWALGGVATALVLQVLLGPNGWFTRYEVYAVFFASLLLVRIVAAQPPFLFSYFCAGLLLFSMPYVMATQHIISAELEIYHQQYQMHRFLQDFYKDSVAVNDLGLVAYARPSASYVLDLWGLASPEAAREKHKNAAWLEGITTRHDVALAMIYPSWFESIPTSWEPLGSMCLTGHPVVVQQRCVVFYSTELTRRTELEGLVRQFAGTLPGHIQWLPGIARVSNVEVTPTLR